MYHPKLILFALCNPHVQDWQMVLQVSHGVRWCSKTSTHGFVKNSTSVTVSSSNVPVRVRKVSIRHPAAAAPVKLTYQTIQTVDTRKINQTILEYQPEIQGRIHTRPVERLVSVYPSPSSTKQNLFHSATYFRKRQLRYDFLVKMAPSYLDVFCIG